MARTMNEAEVKTTIVLPLLAKYGVQPEEISLERSFALRLGRHTIQVDTQKQIATAQPRLDILVYKNGRSLFVIETKAEVEAEVTHIRHRERQMSRDPSLRLLGEKLSLL